MKRTLGMAALLLVGCATDPLAHPKHDSQEDDPRLRAAFKEAEAYADYRTANAPRRLGEIHEYWRFKKEFLSRKYGIHWKDPSEMNPNIAFD